MAHTFKAGDTGKTRSGRAYRVIADNIRNEEPLVVVVEEWDHSEGVLTYCATGAFWGDSPKTSGLDLMPPAEARAALARAEGRTT